MVIREALEDHERQWLASYAMKSADSKGRVYLEKEHDFRTAFQRDRDRIIHSTAFRRLEYKTQVFVNHEGDHYRTRLTHTLEMNQIARTIGRALRLNEDLVEAIALAHDLGHGPFGHAGQEVLSKLMEGHGGFEHNRQCLRIVEQLEESYSAFPGLNLTFEVREGLRKHARKRLPSLEAEIVDLADSIAYNGHDLDDGLRAGLLEIKSLEKIKLWREAYRYISEKSLPGDETIKRKTAIRLIINRMANDLIYQTMKNIKKYRIQKPSDLVKPRMKIVGFSRDLEKKVDEIKDFLMRHLYLHHRVVRMTEKGKRFIHELFRLYVARPEQLPPHVRQRTKMDGLYRSVCDYIAGMTDRFALDEYNKLFSPFERV
ncbi:MAG: deoxyguanosinetriphosphate triphosphohydrolase [Candidatus Omnitrophica bacterium]|nr:deoxyguanosinetriphosphate triphosphohydrolase [Candidatus Omnitrophota bacterium]